MISKKPITAMDWKSRRHEIVPGRVNDSLILAMASDDLGLLKSGISAEANRQRDAVKLHVAIRNTYEDSLSARCIALPALMALINRPSRAHATSHRNAFELFSLYYATLN